MSIKQDYDVMAKKMSESLTNYFEGIDQLCIQNNEMDGVRQKMLDLLQQTRNEFKAKALELAQDAENGNPCPRDWTRCDNGSCVPPGEPCEG